MVVLIGIFVYYDRVSWRIDAEHSLVKFKKQACYGAHQECLCFSGPAQ